MARSPNEKRAAGTNRGAQLFSDDFLPLEEKGLLTLLDGDFEVIPGVTVKVTNGPCNGHQIVLIEGGSEKIAYLGDLIPTPYHLPLRYISALDEAPNVTLEQKRRLLRMAIEDGWLLVYAHGYDTRASYIQQRNGTPQIHAVDI